MVSREQVMHILSGIEDPELKRPLTELGMIKSVDINGGDVTVGVTLTVPGCPLKHKISEDITSGLKLIAEVNSVKVEFGVMNDQQREQLKEKLGVGSSGDKGASTVGFAKRFIAVSSGKGGVGKSTVTANVAVSLAAKGYKVGILDADVYGFSIPRMLGVNGQPTAIDDKLVPLRRGDNLQVMSMGFFVNEDEPVIWRGPLLHKAIQQFITDVAWDQLDFLFLDLPPGTGDVTLTVAQAIPATELLVVTTPQATATHVAGRVAKLASKTKLKVIGVIENMAYYEREGSRDYIFGKEGGHQLARQLGVDLLGEIPLRTSIRIGSDDGAPAAAYGSESDISTFAGIADAIVNKH